MAADFYWRHARDSLLTTSALRMFQLVASREGEVLADVKGDIDKEYLQASGSTTSARNGGIVQTQFSVFREAGWASLAPSDEGERIVITPAGKQALTLLTRVPDFLKAAPYFIIELLSRFQLHNPARPASARNSEYDAQLASSTIFPYWTLFKIMRGVGGWITGQELRRFVFKLHRQEDVEPAILSILRFREAQEQGESEERLDILFGKELEGAVGEPKYIMGRLGTQVGSYPAVVEKEGASKWVLNQYYLPFIDEILSNEPVFKDYLDEETWMQHYGEPVALDDTRDERTVKSRAPLQVDFDEDDEVWQEVVELLEAGSRAILFSGPPGTGKTWYARRIAAKLVDGDSELVRFVQFHPSMSYDDFVEGYVPQATHLGASFSISDKVFLQLCDAARSVAPAYCVLVIDEINRGDLGRILGELLTYIEPAYRGHDFTLAYSGRTVSVPHNLVILGTFNPFDKSVVELDDAIDRRFDRISLEPSAAKLHAMLREQGVDEQMVGRLIAFFQDINRRMRHGLGHTLFLSVRDDASLRRLWNRKLSFIFEKAFRFEPELLGGIKESFVQVFSSPEDAGI